MEPPLLSEADVGYLVAEHQQPRDERHQDEGQGRYGPVEVLLAEKDGGGLDVGDDVERLEDDVEDEELGEGDEMQDFWPRPWPWVASHHLMAFVNFVDFCPAGASGGNDGIFHGRQCLSSAGIVTALQLTHCFV